MARQFDAVHARHADVDQRNVNRASVHRLDGQFAIGGFGDHFVWHLAHGVGQQITQTSACRSFVVDDDDG